MALELTSTTIGTELVRREEHTNSALATSENQSIDHANIQQEIHAGIKQGITQTRHSLNKVFVIKSGTENNGDGTVTAGVYETSTDKIGFSVEAVSQTVSSSLLSEVRWKVAEHVKSTINHEGRHQDSITSAKKNGQLGMISQHFGHDVFHDLQETMARRGTTKGKDAYDAEEARAANFASRLNLSLDALINLVHAGEEAKIVLAASRSGYLKPSQPELN